MHNRRLPYHVLWPGRWVLMACGCLCWQCVQTYVSPYKSPPTGYLVVEGFISSNSPTQYLLTRTIELPGDSAIPTVTGANVRVEGSDSSVYPLADLGQGRYGDSLTNLSTTVQYRLRISTPDGETYLSDFVPLKPAPPIDSVNWVYGGYNGVDIYVNTHEPSNSTRYYRWAFDQTWEYHMAQESHLRYDPTSGSVVVRTPAQQVYRCWKDEPSTSLYLFSTEKLTNDIVYEFPLVHIPFGAQQLSVLYTIFVTQYGLTADAYNFYTQLQKNTESLGSIFDQLPTGLTSNIHDLTHPDRQAVGFISAGSVQQARLFIYYDQLTYWEYTNQCLNPNIEVVPDSIQYYFDGSLYTPIDFGVGVYTANSSGCIDCTTQGGSNQKPSYWPN